MTKFTNKEKADEAEREVKMRKQVYPNQVAIGRYSRETADKRIAIMEEIAQEYRKEEEMEGMGKLL